MNCQDMERNMLLAESGELSSAQQSDWERHVNGCPKCQSYRDDVARVAREARLALAMEDPSAETLARIRSHIRGRSSSSTVIRHEHIYMGILALAASLIFLVGGWWLLPSPHSSNRIQEIHGVMAMLSERPVTEPMAYDSGLKTEDCELKHLAHQLLLMEGFAVDDVMDWECLDAEEDWRPTTLQEHSTDEIPGIRCV